MSDRRFVQKGNKIVIKENVPDIELTPKNVLNNIAYLNNALGKIDTQIQQSEATIKQGLEQQKNFAESLKGFMKWEQWATDIQISSLKHLIPEAVELCIPVVREKCAYDDTMNAKDNSMQFYNQLVQYVGRYDKIADEVDANIIKTYIFTKTMVENPWIGQTEEQLKSYVAPPKVVEAKTK